MSLPSWTAASAYYSFAVFALFSRTSTTSPSTPNYKLTADFDERNTFDVQEYLQHRLKLKESEVCSVYEADLPETTEAPDEDIPQN